MERIKVSVIIPVHNVSCYIEKCARSLLEQTIGSIEFIFVDDCSTDDSISILENVIADYPERKNVTHIERQDRNRGQSYARNIGLKIASGEYIAYCDADDWVDARMYQVLYEEASSQKADICYCDYNIVHKDSIQCQHAVDCSGLDKVDFMKRYMTSGLTVVWNMIVRRDVYFRNNLKFPQNITYCEDFWLSVRLMHFAEKVIKVNSSFYYYNRLNAASLLNEPSREACEDMLCAYLETVDFFRNTGDIEHYEKELSWRILAAKQDMVLNPEEYDRFLAIYPDSHRYITSCPEYFCNRKIKFMMWMLTHGLGIVVTGINHMRKLARR